LWPELLARSSLSDSFIPYSKPVYPGAFTDPCYWPLLWPLLRLIVVTSNLADVIDEAKRLSSLRTLAGGHRGFDILHVASALTMNASQFLTFDTN